MVQSMVNTIASTMFCVTIAITLLTPVGGITV
jgi:hypothetical protein